MIIPGYYYGKARARASGSICTFRIPGFHKGHAVLIWFLPDLTHWGSQLFCWAGGLEDERAFSFEMQLRGWESVEQLHRRDKQLSGRCGIWERGNHPLEPRISEAGRDLWKSLHLNSFPKAGSPSADCLGSPLSLWAACSIVWPSSLSKTIMIFMFKWCFLVVF